MPRSLQAYEEPCKNSKNSERMPKEMPESLTLWKNAKEYSKLSQSQEACHEAKNNKIKHVAKIHRIPCWYSLGAYKQLKPPSFKIPRIGKIILDEKSSAQDNEWFSYMYTDKDDRRNIFSFIYAMEEECDQDDEYDSDVIIY